jgi:chromosome partitioning protein
VRKIAVSLSKGGVGKTTTSVSLAHGLAKAGFSVLLVDTDTQGQAASMLGARPSVGLAELAAKEIPADHALLEARSGLFLLAGGKSLAGFKRLIARKDYGGERTLAEALAPFEDRFDYVVVDTAPGWDALSVNVLFYVEEILAPVSLEIMTLAGLADFTKTLADVQKYKPELTLRYVLPTFLDGRVRKSGEIFEQLQARYKEELCSPIRYSVRLSESPGFGQTVYEYAPGSAGAEDYQKLTERVAGDGRA